MQRESAKESNVFCKFAQAWVSAAIAVLLVISPATAKPPAHQGTSASAGARLMSHLSLDMAGFQNAILRETENHRYLYIQSADKGTLTVVDVSRRKKPKMVRSIDLPQGTTLENATFQGDVMLSGGNRNAPAPPPAAHPSGDGHKLTVWDMSTPGSPKVVKQFNDVKKVIRGSGNIDYVLDANGLWIVQINSKEARDWNDYVDHIGP
jgi:hypothetical protein